MSMKELLEKVIRHGLKLGATEVHAVINESRGFEVTINIDDISDAIWKSTSVLEVAVIVDRRIGIANTQEVTEEEALRTVERALSLAKGNKPNPWWKALPGPKPHPEVSGTYDSRIAEIAPEEVIEMARVALDEVKGYDPRVGIWAGVINTNVIHVYVANSRGVEGEDKATSFTISLVASAKEAGAIGSFAEEIRASRALDIEVQEVAREVARKAVESLGARSIKSFKGSLIMDYYTARDFFATFVEALRGDNVWKGRSPLRDKIGEMVAIDNLTIIDDGIMPKGLMTSKFDYEGHPRGRTPLVEKGILKGYLHNSYTANIMGVESTGNASSLLSVAPSNIVISQGDYECDELISEVKKGLLIKRFSGYMRYEDGIVSGVAKQAFLIENGRIVHPVKECMISGNIYEMIKKISGMTRSRKNILGIITPTIRVEDVSIVSKA
ncbi:MAG: hypothetical protein DRN15_00990 [Thermoprotei archaeon]|nr:MAG: hypothetical protein DRN15_00990 [Thermoprotei archaeon]RLF25290.1 MAG: hypothetical protein DRM97_02375 [Thermoprotei archaeon]